MPSFHNEGASPPADVANAETSIDPSFHQLKGSAPQYVGTITIGSVTSGPAPAVTNGGTPQDAILNFVLQKGDKGDKGDPLADGDYGDVMAAGGVYTVQGASGDFTVSGNVIIPAGGELSIGGTDILATLNAKLDKADAPEKLTADRTYYVSPTGSDSNDGLTAAAPFASIQHAIDTAYGLRLNKHQVTISLAAGTYTGSLYIEGQPLGGYETTRGDWLQIIGDETTPGNVVIQVTNGTALTLRNGAYALVAGIHFSTVTGGYGWVVMNHSTLEYRNCEFGNVVSDMIVAQNGSVINALGNLSVLGNADSFVHCTTHSRIQFDTTTITFNGNVFSTYLWGLNDATVSLAQCTIAGVQPTGGITIHENALLSVGSLTGSYLGGSAPVVNDGGRVTSDLYTSRTFYVRPDGNDANDGLRNTAARAFLTLQGAIDAIAAMDYRPELWSSASGPVINLAAGTYAGAALRDLKYQTATLQGDPVTPANVVIAGSSDGLTAVGSHTVWTVNGVKITAGGGSCLRAEQGSTIEFENVDFGSASQNHILTASNGNIIAIGNYTISAGASRHIFITHGWVDITGRTVTITGTPAFTAEFVRLDSGGAFKCWNAVFSGTATGRSYRINALSVIDTSGQPTTFLPGDVAGVTSGGGTYA